MDTVIGSVTAKVRVNVRQGAPSTQATVISSLAAGTTVQVIRKIPGENVLGIADWYGLPNNEFIWAGGVGSFVSEAAQASVGSARIAPSPMVVDLYHGDSVESFADAKAAGVMGIIHKATTGATGTDDKYQSRRQTAIAAGLLWGAYHWGTAAPIAQQVANFLNLAKPDGNTLIALDFERMADDQMTIDGVRAFSDAIFQALQRRPVIYSSDLIKTGLGTAVDPFFGSHRLWLAEYNSNPRPQASWPSFWLWQYTDGATGPGIRTVPGISGNRVGNVDCNYFDGTPAQLAAQWAS